MQTIAGHRSLPGRYFYELRSEVKVFAASSNTNVA